MANVIIRDPDDPMPTDSAEFMVRLKKIHERRKLSRHAVYCDGTLVVGGKAETCKVLDISAGGAHIKFDHPVEAGQPISLKIDGCGEFECEMVWHEDTHIGGLFFLGQSRKNAQLAKKVVLNFANSAEQRRTAPRRSVIFPARVLSGNLALDARIKDISASGAQLILDEVVDVIAPFILKTDRFGNFFCDIVWKHEKRIGVTFLKTPAKFAEFVKHELPSTD